MMMNVTTISTGSATQHTTTTTLDPKTFKIEMIDDQMSLASDDDDDDYISSDGSMYGESDLATMAAQDDVANQLAAAGPVGVAAAAAIASSKKRKRPHSFETNPSVRKRQQNRLLRKLRGIIDEFTGRVGKQAVVLVATPGKPNTSYKVFGAKPLEDVVRNLKNIVMEELESALAQQAPPPPQEDPSLFELPPLIIDGIPTPVEKMTQAQLRAFIPLMLKYSTGRGKPGWGRESTRPPWWPKELPWANVRMDARSEDDKQKISWTHALRKIVINCYKYHGREDLLPTFADEEDKVGQLIAQAGEDDDEDDEDDDVPSTTTTIQTIGNASTNTSNYTTQTVLSTIQNADGTVSFIQVDPNNPIITLPDGTTAQVQGVATLHQGEGGATIQAVQSLSDVNGHENMTVDLTEATVAQDGQIYITAEDGQGYPVSMSNMITVPVSASMYQSMMANIQQIHTNSDGTVCITPMQVDSQSNTNNNNNNTNNNNTSSSSSSGNSSNNNNGCNNNSTNQYQCYSIMTSTAGQPQPQRLMLSSQTMPPNAACAANTNNNHNNTNNNNNNSISSTRSSSGTSSSSTRCQIFNQQSSLAHSNHHNSSQHNHQQQQQQHHLQQQQQQQCALQVAGTKLFIANGSAAGIGGNLLNITSNNNNNNNTSTNNNNLTHGNNNKMGNATTASTTTQMPLPIILTHAAGATPTSATTPAATATAMGKRNNAKRRKQTFAKVVVPIKIECNAVANCDGDGDVVDGRELLPTKAIKLELNESFELE